MKNFRIIKVYKEVGYRFKIQLRILWFLWYDYTEEEEPANDGWGTISKVRYWTSISLAQDFIHKMWGDKREEFVKHIKLKT